MQILWIQEAWGKQGSLLNLYLLRVLSPTSQPNTLLWFSSSSPSTIPLVTYTHPQTNLIILILWEIGSWGLAIYQSDYLDFIRNRKLRISDFSEIDQNCTVKKMEKSEFKHRIQTYFEGHILSTWEWSWEGFWIIDQCACVLFCHLVHFRALWHTPSPVGKTVWVYWYQDRTVRKANQREKKNPCSFSEFHNRLFKHKTRTAWGEKRLFELWELQSFELWDCDLNSRQRGHRDTRDFPWPTQTRSSQPCHASPSFFSLPAQALGGYGAIGALLVPQMEYTGSWLLIKGPESGQDSSNPLPPWHWRVEIVAVGPGSCSEPVS